MGYPNAIPLYFAGVSIYTITQSINIMKTIIISVLILITIGLFACLKQAPDPAFMTEDPTWVEYRDEVIRMADVMIADAKGRGTIKSMRTADLDVIYSPEVARELRAFEQRSNDMLRRIIDKYGPLDQEAIRLDILKTMQPAEGIALTNNCDKEYFTCMAKALATAIMCHAGCIALSAGFGTPMCVLLCMSIEISDGLECAEKYCGANAKNPVIFIKTQNN